MKNNLYFLIRMTLGRRSAGLCGKSMSLSPKMIVTQQNQTNKKTTPPNKKTQAQNNVTILVAECQEVKLATGCVQPVFGEPQETSMPEREKRKKQPKRGKPKHNQQRTIQTPKTNFPLRCACGEKLQKEVKRKLAFSQIVTE